MCVWVCFVLSISAVLAVFGEKDRGSIGFDHSIQTPSLSLSLSHTLTHTDTRTEGAEVSMVLQSLYYHCSLNQITQAVISFFSEVHFKSKFTSYMTISGGKKLLFLFFSLCQSLFLSLHKAAVNETVHWNRAGSLEHIKLTIRIWRGVTETHRQHERERGGNGKKINDSLKKKERWEDEGRKDDERRKEWWNEENKRKKEEK